MELILPSVLACLALGAALLALRATRLRRYLRDTPTSETAGVFIGDVEVKGAVACEHPVLAPLSEQRCVHHQWSISEDWGRWVTETYQDSKGNTRTRRRYETGSTPIASGGDTVPFYVADASGVLLVRPEGASIEPAEVVSMSCGVGHAWYYGKGPVGAVADSLHRRNFHEVAIPLGARVFVAGRARERSDIVAAEIASHDDARMFLISVRDEKQVVRGYGIASWVWAFLGLALAVAAAFPVAALLAAGREGTVLVVAAALAAYAGALAIGWGWMAFNSIVSLRQRVRRAWSNIEVELARRAGLIPNLVEVVQAAGLHEKDTQRVVALLRAQAAIVPSQARNAGAGVRGIAPVLRAVSEAYPDLAAGANFLALQRELSRTESRIALARSYYNGIATAFNARLLVVPDRLLAAIARLRPFDLFDATDLERETPRLRFEQAAP